MFNAANQDVNRVATNQPPFRWVCCCTETLSRSFGSSVRRDMAPVLLGCHPTSHLIQRDTKKKPLGNRLEALPRHWVIPTARHLASRQSRSWENHNAAARGAVRELWGGTYEGKAMAHMGT